MDDDGAGLQNVVAVDTGATMSSPKKQKVGANKSSKSLADGVRERRQAREEAKQKKQREERMREQLAQEAEYKRAAEKKKKREALRKEKALQKKLLLAERKAKEAKQRETQKRGNPPLKSAADAQKLHQQLVRQNPLYKEREQLLAAERKLKDKQKTRLRAQELAKAPRYPIEDLEVSSAKSVVHALPSGEMKMVPHKLMASRPNSENQAAFIMLVMAI